MVDGRGRSEPHRRDPALRFYARYATESEISCCVKYMVFGFNVLFWLAGLVLLLFGVWAQVEKNPYSQLGSQLNRFYLDPTFLLLIVGALTFILGFSGCVGALRENTCLLSFYAAILGVLLLTQLAVAILAFVFKDWVKDQIEGRLDDMVISYRDDPDLQSVIDWIQKDWLHCCGIHSPDDWDLNIYFNESSKALGSPEAGGVPFSCCKLNAQQEYELTNLYCGHGVRLADYVGRHDYFQDGCMIKLIEWVNRNTTQVGVALLVMAVLQILGICFSQNLRSDIFAQKSRWQYSHR